MAHSAAELPCKSPSGPMHMVAATWGKFTHILELAPQHFCTFKYIGKNPKIHTSIITIFLARIILFPKFLRFLFFSLASSTWDTPQSPTLSPQCAQSTERIVEWISVGTVLPWDNVLQTSQRTKSSFSSTNTSICFLKTAWIDVVTTKKIVTITPRLPGPPACPCPPDRRGFARCPPAPVRPPQRQPGQQDDLAGGGLHVQVGSQVR